MHQIDSHDIVMHGACHGMLRELGSDATVSLGEESKMEPRNQDPPVLWRGHQLR